MNVMKFPLARITYAFILGTIFSYYFKSNEKSLFLVTGISFFLFSTIYFLLTKKVQKTFVFGVSSYLISFLIGSLTLVLHTESNRSINYTHCKKAFEKNQLIKVTIREKLKENNFNQRYVALVQQINDSEYSGKVIISLKKGNIKHSLQIGNILYIYGKLIASKSAKNPFQFDYGKYLENKQIYASINISKNTYIKSKNIKKDIWYFTDKIRLRIIRNLNPKATKSDELNVATALVLGQRQDISNEIKKDYQFAGATHLLAVSGLHVGLLMLFINFILNQLSNTKRNLIFKLVIIIASLCFYAVITGLSPSIIRAVVMFSFIAIGNTFQRSNNSIHTLIVSAFIILLFEPYFLFDVGFQLSYTAVFFIIWLQPILKTVWKPDNKLLHFFWNIFTVSMAAQIGTIPICLYYFHQFPGLFFITNLIVIPLITIIMIIAIITMLLAYLNLVPTILISTLELSIKLLNLIIKQIASYDQFVITDIPFNIYLLSTSFLLIFTSIVFFQNKTFKNLVIALTSLILLQSTLLKNKFNWETDKEFVVYYSSKKSILSERNGKKIIVYSLNKSNSELNIIKPYQTQNFIQKTVLKNIRNTYYFNRIKIAMADNSAINLNQYETDVLLLSQSPKINLERLIKNIKPKLVIADASNYKNIQERWKETCLKEKIPFHAIAEKGFYKF